MNRTDFNAAAFITPGECCPDHENVLLTAIRTGDSQIFAIRQASFPYLRDFISKIRP
ncbi:hypothetical protein V6767_00835 [Martelella sp. FLE1502]